LAGKLSRLEYNKPPPSRYNAAMARNLADFLEILAADRDLVRVGAEVDPGHELAQIVRRGAEVGSPALLFDRVVGSKLPLVAGTLGTASRACKVLGVSRLEELSLRTESLAKQPGAQGWLDRLRSPGENPAERYRPKTVRSAAVQQIVRVGRDIDLAQLALVCSWPDESGPSITGGMLLATDSAGIRHLAPVRLVLTDSTSAQLAVVDDGAGDWTRLWQAAKGRGERLPVAIILGGNPAWRIAAASSLAGGGMDAYEWMATIAGAPLEVVKCRTQALEVPAEADIVLEGFVDPTGTLPVTLAAADGPYYRAPVDAPLVHVEAVTERSGCVLPVVVGGIAGGESAVLRKATERLLLPLAKAAIAEMVDYALPGGGSDRFAFLSIRKSIPLGARRAASAFWGMEALATVKFLVVVDEDVDVQQPAEVWRRVGANVDPGRDAFMREGPAAADDHAFEIPFVGRQMGIDATRKLPGERAVAAPALLLPSREVAEMVDRRWQEYGFAEKMK
jgi:4-hydroxy-3-polyprenylbenzoate decarboxylase